MNFSVAAMASYGAFVFYDLWQNGALFFPPPIPTLTIVSPPKAGFGTAPPAMGIWVAFVAAVAICALLGFVFHLVVFRPLRTAPPLAKVAASIGLYLFLFSVLQVRFPNSSGYNFPTLLPQGDWTFKWRVLKLPFFGWSLLPFDGSIILPAAQGLLVLIVVATAVVLWAVFRFTRFGIATRAAAENERGALIIGLNPNRLAAINWVLSTALVGAFGILLASLQTNIDYYQMSLLIVPALAAALVGRFRSFPVVVLASVLFGVTQSWFQAVSTQSWFPSFLTSQGSALPGLQTLVPFLVIIVVLFVRGERLPSRGSEAALRMPKATMSRHPWYGIGAIVLVTAVASVLVDQNWQLALANAVIAAIMCASLTVLTGFMGQVSLMQMTLGGISAFVLAKFCVTHGVVFPVGPILAAAVATVVGLVAAVPALRIRGVNLAVATFAAAVVIESFVYQLPAFQSGFGSKAQADIPAPSLFGVVFRPPGGSFVMMCVVVLGLVLSGVVALRRSHLGRRMLAVRSNERAAAAAGVNVARTKLIAFALSAFIAGIGGTMFGYLDAAVSPQTLSSVGSLLLIAVAYLGGVAVWEGAPISGIIFQGAVLATFFSNIVHISSTYTFYVAGIGLIIASINNQEGIAGTLRDARAAARVRRAARSPHPRPEVTAPAATGVA